jgi:hypothetical protein
MSPIRVIYPTSYKRSVIIPEPTDAEIGPRRALEVHTIGHNLKDGRMMAGMGDCSVPTSRPAASVFRTRRHSEEAPRVLSAVARPSSSTAAPLGPTVRVALNVGPSLAKLKRSLPMAGDGIGREATLIVQAWTR